ncbi:polysaccharide biosynthesis/export family protein [Parabacteroides sp. PF5-6]|uniref:polysaccharide biosynthesis/export family protein n=1 Tax=Parabacteroides sp. PF5-6 TaxID=1742403 RepID=UPI002406CB3F|nr:polysaccharide biosynthesis/export family protein [Parabacteroides sp. PF5-6]MDF9830643.1 polysaccharide export outer membrane protein [Parabacteroides sp. PF5-6]
MRLKFAALSLVFLLVMGACSVPKDVTYFQGIDELTTEQLQQMAQTYHTPICPDDLLTITVTAWDPNVVTPFNPPTYAYATIHEGEAMVQSAPALYTYLVDQEGYIQFPVLGKVHVQGLTKQELADRLRADISKYIDDPLVKVSLVNFKITALGEVSRPGTLTIRHDRISILDFLGSVGDVTINANRKNILILRDNNGVVERGRIDLTDPAIFASPYYYLQQNDVVYVEPNEAKKKNSRYSQAQQYNITVVSTILSAISVLTVVLTNVF